MSYQTAFVLAVLCLAAIPPLVIWLLVASYRYGKQRKKIENRKWKIEDRR